MAKISKNPCIKVSKSQILNKKQTDKKIYRDFIPNFELFVRFPTMIFFEKTARDRRALQIRFPIPTLTAINKKNIRPKPDFFENFHAFRGKIRPKTPLVRTPPETKTLQKCTSFNFTFFDDC